VQIWGRRWQGALVAEYVTDAAQAASAASQGMTVMQWDDELFSIERRGDHPGYFLNHSCDPVLWFSGAFILKARRRILPGQELTLDYALFEADRSFRSSWACRCGAACCRGLVTGQDWMRADVQQRYSGHFTPLLSKRIACYTARHENPES
jgi:uncharacterized protein